MAKVYKVKAAKDYPQFGIKKGDEHWTWEHFRGPTMRSLKEPKPSQLDNTKMSGALAASENAEAAIETAESVEDVKTAVEEAVSEISSVRDEYQESLDEMGEGLAQGPTGQDIEEKISNLDDWINSLEALNFDEDMTLDQAKEEAMAEIGCPF